ncbi:hypothetical protein V8F06_005974 [Rhypophila decipiens]
MTHSNNKTKTALNYRTMASQASLSTSPPTTPRRRRLSIAALLNTPQSSSITPSNTSSTPSRRLKRAKRRDLTRDQRIGIKALHDFGHTYEEISQRTGYSIRQIQYAVNGHATPQKSKPHHNASERPQRL